MKKVTYEAAITGYFEIDVKDGDYFDVGDLEDALRDYLSSSGGVAAIC